MTGYEYFISDSHNANTYKIFHFFNIVNKFLYV